MNPTETLEAPVDEETRFGFGANWARFLTLLTDQRIREAERSLAELLGENDLSGKTFLDVGCGSGLFSLAARNMGARVRSFDYDPESVACARELRQRFHRNSGEWTVEQGSILDEAYLGSLGESDIVYSWGVLHHTGEMWSALAHAAELVKPGGKLAIAIYNDQGWVSRAWTRIKRTYNRLPPRLRFLIVWPSFIRIWGSVAAVDVLKYGNPAHTWRSYVRERGMSPWPDLIDWVGGYPFEVATPDELFDFYRERGFSLSRLLTVRGGRGCNQLVFRRDVSRAPG